MKAEKKRADLLLVEKGLAASVHKAQALIMSGAVLVNDQPLLKAGTVIAIDSQIRLRGEPSQFVSRGGDKIQAAINHFGIQFRDKVVLDVGASTGGFTDCVLQQGASLVYAVDVGFNQLDYSLRKDSRVQVMEKTHAKDLLLTMFDPRPSIAMLDLSFISLRQILIEIIAVLEEPWILIALVKPQFELGREFIAQGGVVRDPQHQLQAVELVTDFILKLGFLVEGSLASPLKGEKMGNQEYFVVARNA